MEEGESFPIEENDIINKEYYEGVKHMVNCLICLINARNFFVLNVLSV